MSGRPDLSGQAAVVTGGTRGIGRAVVEALAAAGAGITAAYAADEESAAATRRWAHDSGHQVQVVKADVADEAAVKLLFQRHKETFGRCDILVNNAAIRRDALAMLMKLDDWHRTMAVNLTGPFLCSRHALRLMISQRSGRIINIVSPSALNGREGQAAYSASKGGLLSLTKTLAAEGARFNILCNALSPGVVQTEMVDSVPKDVLDDLCASIPLGRFGRPEEIAEAVLFLAGPDAAYMTGQLISVDGGLSFVGKLRAH